MSVQPLRDQLHRQIDDLPAEVLTEVADFTAFVLARHLRGQEHTDWTDEAWQAFALDQFMRDTENDDVEYTLDDAREVYHR